MSVQVICPHCGIVVSDDPEEIGQRRLKNHIDLAHHAPRYCQHCKDETAAGKNEDNVLTLAGKVAEARVRYSQEFQRAKAKGTIVRRDGTTAKEISDGHAHQIAIEVTQSELTVLEAGLEVAKRRLQ